MTTQSRMQQIDTLANYPMGTKPDSFRLIKKTFKSGEPMKTKIICFIAFVSYTFYLGTFIKYYKISQLIHTQSIAN